jgi:hypothetical protein
MATSIVSAFSKLAAAIPTGKPIKQSFSNVMSNYNDDLATAMARMTRGELLTFIIVFILSVWILMFLGAWIFNSSIPKIFPAVNRKITMLEFFGLYLVCRILFT